MPTLEETVKFIQVAHAGQFDKSGVEYWRHPVAVMERLPSWVSDDARHAALLHDVIEDTTLTGEDLDEAGYSRRIIALVHDLSRPALKKNDPPPGKFDWVPPARLTYMQWIRKIANSYDAELIAIKIADMEENMRPDRLTTTPIEFQGIIKRYERALPVLKRGLDRALRQDPV